MGPILRYNALRFGMFVGFLAIGYAVGLAGFVLIVLALLGSSITAYFGLAKQRAAMIVAMQATVEARRLKAAARESREDEYDEQQRRAAETDDTPA